MVEVVKTNEHTAIIGPVGEVCEAIGIKSKDDNWITDDLKEMNKVAKEWLKELAS